MACLTSPAPVSPFFPSLLKRERGISGPAETVSGNFGEFRGDETPCGINPEAPGKTESGISGTPRTPTPTRCRWCDFLRRPGRASGYCASADRPDLPPAYGLHHPLRKLPADQGESCPAFRLHPALGP